MWAEILKALSVYVSSMIKFIFGPIGGKAAGLHLITTMVVTAAGMMTVVIAFTYFGEYIRKIISGWTIKRKDPKVETPKKRPEFFRKYGLAGVAFFYTNHSYPLRRHVVGSWNKSESRKDNFLHAD